MSLRDLKGHDTVDGLAGAPALVDIPAGYSPDHSRREAFSPDPFMFDAILPTQLFGALRQQAVARSGEYRLVAAVLEEAVGCFQKYAYASKKRDRQLFDEACSWIMRRDDKGAAFSFEYICGVLGLDPSYLRAGLRRWLERQHATTDGLAYCSADTPRYL